MKFGQIEIPLSIFESARKCVTSPEVKTTSEIRDCVLADQDTVLSKITDSKINKWIIANRVVRRVLNDLKSAGQVEVVKRGVWKLKNS